MREYRGDDVVPGLARELMLYQEGGGTWRSLSASMGGALTPETLGRLAVGRHGRGRRPPNSRTVLQLYEALGFGITLERAAVGGSLAGATNANIFSVAEALGFQVVFRQRG